MSETTVLYHADNDGFGSAFAIWLKLRDEATYIPVQYGQSVPEIPEDTKILYIVDFSYKREVCEDLATKYKVFIYDHHKTAEKELEGLDYASFDMSKSGCAIVWGAFHDDKPLPTILQYVQDYDLWKFEMPNSEEINLFLSSYPWEFARWENAMDSSFYQLALLGGTAIKRFRDTQVEYALTQVRMMRMQVEGSTYEIPVVNASTNVSVVGNEMCKAYPDAPFSASYCDRKDIRTWSLRSIGEFDVSAIAKTFMGGGHKNAAGFTVSIGWPEIQPDEFIKAFEKTAPEGLK